MSRPYDFMGPAIWQLFFDAEAIFDPGAMPDGIPAPRVTIDLPSTDPEPFHVFVWGQARSFENVSFLTRDAYMITFKVRMTLVASGSTAEDAARAANEYLARAVQITLCDTQLGGTVEEVGIPQIVSSDAWADQSGRRHAGYLIEYEASKAVMADPFIVGLLKRARKAIRKLLGGTE